MSGKQHPQFHLLTPLGSWVTLTGAALVAFGVVIAITGHAWISPDAEEASSQFCACLGLVTITCGVAFNPESGSAGHGGKI